jgi:hypothetical protein
MLPRDVLQRLTKSNSASHEMVILAALEGGVSVLKGRAIALKTTHAPGLRIHLSVEWLENTSNAESQTFSTPRYDLTPNTVAAAPKPTRIVAIPSALAAYNLGKKFEST